MKVGELCDHNIIHTRYIYTGFGMQLVHVKAWNCMKCFLLLWEMSQHTCDHHWLGNGIDLEAMNSPFLLLVTFLLSYWLEIESALCDIFIQFYTHFTLPVSPIREFISFCDLYIYHYSTISVNCFGGRDIAELGLMYLSRLLVLSNHRRLWFFTALVSNIDALIKSISQV